MKIQKKVILQLKNLLKHKLNMYLEVQEKDAVFVHILNSAINRFTNEDINTILNNYQFIVYPKNIDFILILSVANLLIGASKLSSINSALLLSYFKAKLKLANPKFLKAEPFKNLFILSFMLNCLSVLTDLNAL